MTTLHSVQYFKFQQNLIYVFILRYQSLHLLLEKGKSSFEHEFFPQLQFGLATPRNLFISSQFIKILSFSNPQTLILTTQF